MSSRTMMDTLPQWMQEAWPYMVWGGGAAIIINELVFRNYRRWSQRKKKDDQ